MERRRRGSPFLAPSLLAAVLIATPLFAAQKSWDVRDDERIARRTSPSLARERALAKAVAGRIAADVIDGREHPELFLPTELFETAVSNGFVDDAAWRESLAEGVAAAGLPPDFWAMLEPVADAFIRDLRAMKVARREYAEPEKRAAAIAVMRSLERGLCRHRAEALRSAEALFGRERLHQFLYETVASTRSDFMDELATASDLRRQAEGCR